jgi:hypothetical protein
MSGNGSMVGERRDFNRRVERSAGKGISHQENND